MTVTTAAPRGTLATSQRSTARRHQAASAAISTALEDAGCIVVTAAVTDTGCLVDFYDARSLSRALDVIVGAVRATGDEDLAARAGQRGRDAWRVTAGPQTWQGPDGDPSAAQARSNTSWQLTIPGDDLAAVATSLLV